MTEQLKDIEARIATTRQLASVVTAMEGMATARSRQAQAALAGVRAYAATVGRGIGLALGLLPRGQPDLASSEGAHALIILCAEQGFVGLFNEHVLEAAELAVSGRRSSETLRFIIGTRGQLDAEERKLPIDWSHAMMMHPEGAASLAADVIDALYGQLEQRHISKVSLVSAEPASTGHGPTVHVKSLIPFDTSQFSSTTGTPPPLLNLSPAVLLEALVEEYLFAEVCAALILSFAAENEARMRAMMAAHENVGSSLQALVRRSRELRQEEITDEIIELVGASLVKGADERAI